MKLVVALEHHFERTPDGAIWTQVAYAYPFWKSYLAVFDQVQVTARVRDLPGVPPDRLRADGANVSFLGLPDYFGPRQYLVHARQIARTVRQAFQSGDAVILRLPSQIGTVFTSMLAETGYPYGINVVGDPYDVFAPGVLDHPLRVFWRWWFTRQLKRQCANAVAAVYVTEAYLQRRYPCPAYTTSYSDAELTDSAFVDAPPFRHAIPHAQHPFRLVTIASLARLYKAPDVMIEAVSLCRRSGVDVDLTIIGDGAYRAALEEQVRSLGLESRVHFLGQLTAGDAVRAQLDQADAFVLPSKVEGMPRAMLEAMARGLPCIGSTVGGIPEILPPQDLVPPGDAEALATAIRTIARDPERRAQMSRRNLARANAYRLEPLAERHLAFCRQVRERTEAWLARR